MLSPVQLVECPSIYELLADYTFPWDTTPELRLVRAGSAEGDPVQRDSFRDLESVLAAMGKVLEKNTVSTRTGCSALRDSKTFTWREAKRATGVNQGRVRL